MWGRKRPLVFLMSRCIKLLLFLIIIPVALRAQDNKSISGYVTDSKTGESLIGACVTCGDKCAVSNNYGFFSIIIPPKAVINVSYVGYKTEIINLEGLEAFVIVKMDQSETLSEACVTAHADYLMRSSYLGALNISAKQIKAVPALLGESDVIKVLQKIPGVQTGLEGFAGLYVRGGGAEENLQLYDGVPLYNVNHMLGLLSVYTPEAIKSVTFFKGAFPARYGGRVSSIIDVRTNEGNNETFSGMVSVGLLSCRVHMEGPILGNHTTYSMSARCTPTMFVDKQMVRHTGYGYYFYDLNGKVSHKFNNSDKLTFSIYHGKDKYQSEMKESHIYAYYSAEHKTYYDMEETILNNLNFKWINSMAALRWNHIHSSNLFADYCISWTGYRSDRVSGSKTADVIKDLDIDKHFKLSNLSNSGISDINFDISFDFTPDDNNRITFGSQAVYHRFLPKSNIVSSLSCSGVSVSDGYSDNIGYASLIDGVESSLYCEDNISFGERMNMNLGFRSTFFYTQGHPYYVLEPRLSTQYRINDKYSVKMGYSRVSQYVHLLSSGSMSLPTDLWIPITEDIRPVISSIVSLGVYHRWCDGWAASMEGYWKRQNNVLEFKDGKSFLSSSDWKNSVSSGEGLSRGLEFLIEKKYGKTTGWLSYTLSKSVRWFPDNSVNNGAVFPYTYDRRHNLNISVLREFNNSIDLSTSWTYYSGNMMTLPKRVAVVYDSEYLLDIPFVTERNNYRLPSTHHLDLSVNFKKHKQTGIRTWTAGIYNLYGRKNPNFIEQYVSFVDFSSGRNNTCLVVNKVSLLMFVPSISYTITF